MFSLALKAQSVVSHFTVNDGLPSDEVYFVHQDRDGYMWFCTDRGISRYDGYSFENFSTVDGLSHNTAFKCFEDNMGNLWFTMMNGSITIYDKKLRQFNPFVNNKVLLQQLRKQSWVESIAFIDSAAYLFHLDMTSTDDLYKVHTNGRLETIKYSSFMGEMKTSDNLLFLGKLDNYNSSKSTEMVVFKSNFEDKLLNAHSSIYKSLRDYPQPFIRSNGRELYVGLNTGAFMYSPIGLKTKLLDFQSTSICIDKEQFIWVTTLNDGVYLINSPKVNSVFTHNVLLAKERFSLLKVYDERIFVATDMNGLVEIDAAGSILNQVRGSKDSKGIHHLFFTLDSTALFWGDFEYNIETNRQETPKPITGKYHSWEWYKKNYERSIGPEILEYFEKYEEQATFYSFLASSGNSKVYAINIDYLYVKTSQGVLLFNKGKEVGLLNLLGMDEKFTITQISKVDDLVAIAFRGFGVVMVKEEKLVGQIGVADGLVSNLVNKFCVDNRNNRLWLGTNKGISVFSYKNTVDTLLFSKIGDLSKMEGLSSEFIVDMEFVANKIWCLNGTNLDTLSADYSFTKNINPTVVFQGILQGDSSYSQGDASFDYDQNDLEFRFVTITQHKVDNMYRYRFVINGTPQEWKKTNSTSIRAENLAPGNYVFEVAAKVRNSEWGEAKTWSFEITPRFIDQLWVQVLVFLLFGSLVFFLLRQRFKRNSIRAETELALIDLELENEKLQSSSLRQQMNPHFIFNALNSIQRLILEGRGDDATLLLSDFAKLIRSSLIYSRLEFISLDDEVDFLKRYLALEKQRFPSRFEFEILVDESLSDGVMLPPLLIQPICENCVKHAFGQDGGMLTVHIKRENVKNLNITITDDGKGYFSQDSEKITDKSIGLKILESRIQLFKKNDFDASFSIMPLHKDSKKGTVVQLIIPYYE
jgi:sensor histidine kinase YesM